MTTKRLGQITDVLMYALLLAQMMYVFIGNNVHEFLGIAFFVCLVIHIIIKRWCFKTLFKKKSRQRMFFDIVTILLLLTATVLMVSSMGVSRIIFPWFYLFGSANWHRYLATALLTLAVLHGCMHFIMRTNRKTIAIVMTILACIASVTIGLFAVPYMNRHSSLVRKITCPAFFRLLYSSGIRTTEARLLGRGDVDLEHGVLNIRKSKGYDQHYVALHPSMVEVLRAYDAAAEKLQPGREWFFQSSKGGHYCREWVADNFRALWRGANGDAGPVVPYDLRHHYAIENISSWDCDAFEASDKLHRLSKSMGHRWTASTLYYYSIVPALADKLREKMEERFDATVPEVWDDEEEA